MNTPDPHLARRTVPGQRRLALGLDAPVTLDTWQDPGPNRWAFRHYGETVPTAAISRRPGVVGDAAVDLPPLPPLPRLSERLRETYTDALVVQRGGVTVGEWYAPGFGPSQPHLLMSVSKSLLAIVVGALQDGGLIDAATPIGAYVPELSGSAFASATVQEALDMLVAVRYSEEYAAPSSEAQAHDRAGGFRTPRPGDAANVYEFLAGLRADGAHGRRFHYCSAVTDALAWVVEHATGQRYAEVLSDRLWSRIDADHDARIGVDSGGFASANGGVECTARDLARVGHLMLRDGMFAGRRVVSQEWVRRTFGGGDTAHTIGSPKREVFPNFTYRNQWWALGDGSGSIHAAGIHGQFLWLDPQTDTAIVKFSSAPDAVDYRQTRMNAHLLSELCGAAW